MSEQVPIFTDREALEELGPQGIAKFVVFHSARIAESEQLIELANDTLLGYGTNIGIELDKLNETTEITST